jgi:phenylacetate-CoA ligase
LRALVAHAQSTTPWFAEAYRGIDAAHIRSVRELPLLDKDVYRLHGDACRSTDFPNGSTIVSRTSGSTGTPLVYHTSLDDFRERMAFLERIYQWAGVSHRDRKVTVTGNLIVPRGQSRSPFWRHNLPGRQLLLSSYHLLPEHGAAIATTLTTHRPSFIEGYPSALDTLAEILERGKHRSPTIRAIFATAETLHAHQRERIERVFGCKVFNYYGSSEGAPMITECRHGGLHMNTDCGVFECLRPDGSSAGPNEEAELVVTNFGSRAHPLIRYRVRDAVVTSDGAPCACGCAFPRVTAILGRLDDTIWTRDRGWVGRLSQSIKVFPGSVREAQLVQDDPDTLRVRLVREPALFHASQLVAFEADIRERIGERIRLAYEYPESIEKGANNKFKFVVSHLTPGARAIIARGEQP